jgi:hypothetical protein
MEPVPDAAPPAQLPKRRSHRRLILREIARRALRDNQLLPVVDEDNDDTNDSGGDGKGAVVLATQSPSVLPLITSFAGGVRSGWQDYVGDYVLQANLLYVVASVFYVWCNYSRGYLDDHAGFTDGLYIVLAAGFVVDAVLYLYSWQGAWPPPGYAALWGDYINIIASVGYLLTACMYIVETSEAMVQAVMAIEAGMVVLFVIDALLYHYAWLVTVPPGVRGRGCTWVDLDCWGNVLNIVPACLYLVASVVGMWVHQMQRRRYESGAGGGLSSVDGGFGSPADPGDLSPGGTFPALRAMSRINVWADVLYLADALVLCAAWWRDLRLELAPARSADLVVKLRLHARGRDDGHGGDASDDDMPGGDGAVHTRHGLLSALRRGSGGGGGSAGSGSTGRDVRRASLVVSAAPHKGDGPSLAAPPPEAAYADAAAEVAELVAPLLAPAAGNRAAQPPAQQPQARRRPFPLPQPLDVALPLAAGDGSGADGGSSATASSADEQQHAGGGGAPPSNNRGISVSIASVDIETSSLAGEALVGALTGPLASSHGHHHLYGHHQHHPLHPHPSRGHGRLLLPPHGDNEADDGVPPLLPWDEDGYDVCGACKRARGRCR